MAPKRKKKIFFLYVYILTQTKEKREYGESFFLFFGNPGEGGKGGGVCKLANFSRMEKGI